MYIYILYIYIIYIYIYYTYIYIYIYISCIQHFGKSTQQDIQSKGTKQQLYQSFQKIKITMASEDNMSKIEYEQKKAILHMFELSRFKKPVLLV